MKYNRNAWLQIRSITVEELMRALEKDGYKLDSNSNSKLSYRHSVTKNRIVIHYHPGKSWGDKFLQGLLDDIGWTEKDLRRLKLIK